MADIDDLIDTAMNQQPTKFADAFAELMAQKTSAVLDDVEINVAQNMIASPDEDEELEDEFEDAEIEDDEIEDEDFEEDDFDLEDEDIDWDDEELDLDDEDLEGLDDDGEDA